MLGHRRLSDPAAGPWPCSRCPSASRSRTSRSRGVSRPSAGWTRRITPGPHAGSARRHGGRSSYTVFPLWADQAARTEPARHSHHPQLPPPSPPPRPSSRTTAGPASAKDLPRPRPRHVHGAPSPTSKVGARDGCLEVEVEVEFEYDYGCVSDAVTLSDNGARVAKGPPAPSRRAGPSSSAARVANRAGKDTIRAIARSRMTGQTCSAAASV